MKTEPEINMGLSYPINFAGSNTVRKKTTAPQQCKTSLDWNLIEHGFGVRRALLGVARTLRLGQVLWSGVIVLCPSEWVMR